MSTESAISKERRQQVQAALSDIQRLLGDSAVTREGLAAVTARLEQLAQRQELFPVSDFPPPAAGQGVGASTRYRLNPDDAPGVPALYLNSINPGKTTLPHNHTTWATIVALSGQELNRVYLSLIHI